ncbi:MAG: SDR family oxidoreductase [Alphaproteobacteria bacterium]|nr:SDR family oxidoreductase [Alphaproteobacteria bacterium]
MVEVVGRLNGLVAMVTGASRGIGKAIATAFVREGATVWLAARDAGTLDGAVAAMPSGPGRATAYRLDVSDGEACRAAVAAQEAAHGRADILVSAAGVYHSARFLDYPVAEFERLMRTNLYGPIHLMQAALPGMQARRFGRIVNIASTAGKWASPNQSGYNASKHALVGLTRCVALESAKSGVTVNAICPGVVDTDMIHDLWQGQGDAIGITAEAARNAVMTRVPQGRLLDPAEVAELAVYMASREAGGMTGQSVLLDGGILYV